MKRDVALRVGDILEYIRDIEKNTEGMDERAFIGSSLRRDAVLYELSVIQEAMNYVGNDLRKALPVVDWSAIELLNTDLSRAWGIVKNDLPKIKKVLENSNN